MKLEQNLLFGLVVIFSVVLFVPCTKASEKSVYDTTVQKSTSLLDALYNVLRTEELSEGIEGLFKEIVNEIQNMGATIRKQETTIRELKQDVNVMFVATVQHSFAETGQYYLPLGIVSFDFLLVDLGNNFDRESGEFTAPVPGKYQFMVDAYVEVDDHDYAALQVKVNGGSIKDIWDRDYHYENNRDYYQYDNRVINLNGFVVTDLKMGDIVTISVFNGLGICGYDQYLFTFTGTLLSII